MYISCLVTWVSADGDMSTVVVDYLVRFPWYTAVEGGWGRRCSIRGSGRRESYKDDVLI